jgi:hypothetical protein
MRGFWTLWTAGTWYVRECVYVCCVACVLHEVCCVVCVLVCLCGVCVLLLLRVVTNKSCTHTHTHTHTHIHTHTHTHATQVTMAEMLMHGLGVDAEDSEGRTHLYRAMQSRERGMDTRTVKMLLEHKVCVCVCVCVCTDVGLLKQKLSKT